MLQQQSNYTFPLQKLKLQQTVDNVSPKLLIKVMEHAFKTPEWEQYTWGRVTSP